MSRAKVYRNIERRQQYLGLEAVDAVALAVVLWLLLTFHRGALGINGLVMVICYVALRVAKRGKPAGYTTDLVRFAVSRRAFLSAAEPDEHGRRHPFRPRSANAVDDAMAPRHRSPGALL
jgi:hypothetical protein